MSSHHITSHVGFWKCSSVKCCLYFGFAKSEQQSWKMWIFGWKGQSGFSARSTAEEVTQGIDGTGLTAIVTGLVMLNYSSFSSGCFCSLFLYCHVCFFLLLVSSYNFLLCHMFVCWENYREKKKECCFSCLLC